MQLALLIFGLCGRRESALAVSGLVQIYLRRDLAKSSLLYLRPEVEMNVKVPLRCSHKVQGSCVKEEKRKEQ